MAEVETGTRRFLTDYDLRPVSLGGEIGVRPVGLALGRGSRGLEVVITETDRRPQAQILRKIWRARQAGRAVPLLLITLYDDRAALCGPGGDEPPTYTDLEIARVERICSAALSEPDRNAALRFLRSVIPEIESPLPGLRNEGLFATHELAVGVPKRKDWAEASRKAVAGIGKRGQNLIRSLGFEITPTPGPTSILLAGSRKTAIAVFLHRSEAIEVASERFSGLSPVSYALAKADAESLPYVVVSTESTLRVYPVRTGVGTGRRGRTETFIEAHLDLISEAQAGYIWLLFSAEALSSGGTFEQILERSADYAADLGVRLRERVYGQVVPKLATAIAQARGLRKPNAAQLSETYQMALVLLFRLLFIAYAEDKELLPYRTNALYKARSLKQKSKELLLTLESGADFDKSSTQWEELLRLFQAVDVGNKEWGVPPYNGGLFSTDPEIAPIGAKLAGLTLSNEVLGPILSELLLDDSPEGKGPIDFRTLGVREFGTIYEGLLESELSVAETDLALDQNGSYAPRRGKEEPVVKTGEIYLHDASGARSATGSYYTKSFAVEHLLEQALEPALGEHLARLDELSDSEAAARFFDFRIADIAMGSGHFLVSAIDRIERALSQYLAKTRLPQVVEELLRLRQTATEALGPHCEGIEIEDTQLLRRQITRHCIYGVDLNPIAVELARVSIWIHTFIPGLPLSFLDRNLVAGNSVVSVGTFEEVAGLFEKTLFSEPVEQLLGSARRAVQKLGKLADATAAEIREARKAHAEAQRAIEATAALFDVVTAGYIDSQIRESLERATKSPEHLAELVHSRTRKRAQELLESLSPFHFPIAFPEVFLRPRHGFDVIVGNPPWNEVLPEEHSFWPRHYPGFRGLSQREREQLSRRLHRERPDLIEVFDREKHTAELLHRILTAGQYPGLETGDTDLYKAFCWRFWQLASNDGGRIGVVLPRQALNAKGSAEFRKRVLTDGSITDLTTLLNKGGWVFEEAEHRYTISLLCMQKARTMPGTTVPIRGPFSNLLDFRTGTVGEATRFPVDGLLAWTDDAAFPLLPTQESAEVFLQLRKAPRLDLNDLKSWRALPHAELHATNDKRLMRFAESQPEGTWPVFKGETFDIWEPDRGQYYAWVDPKRICAHLQQKRLRAGRSSHSPFHEFPRPYLAREETLPCLGPRIAFRNITRATDTRTFRAALVPPEVTLSNAAPYLLWPRGDERDQAYLLGVLCSIPLDWYARRFVEINLNFFILNPFPVPRPPRTDERWKRTVALAGRLACPNRRFSEWARAVGVEVGPVVATERDQMIAELDAVVAHLYGLSKKQLVHIFETFHEGWDFGDRLKAVLKHYDAWARRT